MPRLEAPLFCCVSDPAPREAFPEMAADLGDESASYVHNSHLKHVIHSHLQEPDTEIKNL